LRRTVGQSSECSCRSAEDIDDIHSGCVFRGMDERIVAGN
jgi:hypothetical protein